MNGESAQALLDSMILSRVDEHLKSIGVDAEALKKGVGKPSVAKQLALADQVWRNNGWIDPEERYRYAEGDEREDKRIKFGALVSSLDKRASELQKSGAMQDALELTSARILIPKVITRIVREAAEPILVGTSILRRINFSAGETITFPAVGGGMWAEDIPPGGEYPEQSMEFAGSVTAKVGKSGLKVKITEEMVRYSMFDVMTMHVQQGSRALARHKENKIFTMISGEGRVVFDNSGGTSLYGSTTGRHIDGLFNKTICLDDLFVMYATQLNAGFIPSMLLMNPMGWLIFARDPVMRNFGFLHNGPLFQPAQGQPGQGPTLGGNPNLLQSVGQDPEALNPQATTYTTLPSLFPVPMKVITSPFVAFTAATKVTDIIMADPNEMGLIVVDEDPVTESWDDPMRDIRSVKIRERYGLALDNQGDAVAQAKNIRIAKGYDWEDNLSLNWAIGSGTLPTGFVAGI